MNRRGRSHEERHDLFANALGEMHVRGWVSRMDCIAPGVWCASHTGEGWANVAYHMAALLPGTVWPGRRGLSVVIGDVTCRVMEHKAKRELFDARAAAGLMGMDASGFWTVGQVARAMLAYVADARSCPTATDKIVAGIEGGYHDCTPGEYVGTWHQFDCSGYYFQFLRRAESLRVRPGSCCLFWDPLTPNERAKWFAVLSCIEECKVLRNSIVGSAMGSAHERAFYVRDSAQEGRSVKKFKRLPGGPFRGLGQLIVRSGYELCLLASNECHSVYSTMDSVMTRDATPPKVWERYGIYARLDASGDADLIRRACYRIGHKATLAYQHVQALPEFERGLVLREGTERLEPPDTLYHKMWLS